MKKKANQGGLINPNAVTVTNLRKHAKKEVNNSLHAYFHPLFYRVLSFLVLKALSYLSVQNCNFSKKNLINIKSQNRRSLSKASGFLRLSISIFVGVFDISSC